MLLGGEGARGPTLMGGESKIVMELAQLAADEGFKEETPEFDRRLRQLKVEKCREMKGQSTCSECPVFEFCDLAKHVLRDHRGIG